MTTTFVTLVPRVGNWTTKIVPIVFVPTPTQTPDPPGCYVGTTGSCNEDPISGNGGPHLAKWQIMLIVMLSLAFVGYCGLYAWIRYRYKMEDVEAARASAVATEVSYQLDTFDFERRAATLPPNEQRVPRAQTPPQEQPEVTRTISLPTPPDSCPCSPARASSCVLPHEEEGSTTWGSAPSSIYGAESIYALYGESTGARRFSARPFSRILLRARNLSTTWSATHSNSSTTNLVTAGVQVEVPVRQNTRRGRREAYVRSRSFLSSTSFGDWSGFSTINLTNPNAMGNA